MTTQLLAVSSSWHTDNYPDIGGWNYLYLSQKLERLSDNNQKDKLLSAISSHSPMSWAHINLLGEYDFSDEKLKDSVGIRLPKIIV